MLNLFLSPLTVMDTQTSLFGKNIPKFPFFFNVYVDNTLTFYRLGTLLTELFLERKVNVLADKYGCVLPLLFWIPDGIQLIFIKFLFFRSV